MARALLLLLASFAIGGCCARDARCPRPPACPPPPCAPRVPLPDAATQGLPADEMRKAAEAGLNQWLYDEVYAANRDLQACLLKASQLTDPAQAKDSHDQCIAQFEARLKAAEENVIRTRKVFTEVIDSIHGAAPPR